MRGYVYCVNNKTNLKKRIATLKIRKIPYTIFDEYFVAGYKIEDEEFNREYYCKFIGTVEVRKFKDNEVEVIIESKKKLEADGCELLRGTKRYTLRAFGKTYFFKRNKDHDEIFDKFFTKKQKSFFEFNHAHSLVEDKQKMIDKYSFKNSTVDDEMFDGAEELNEASGLEVCNTDKEEGDSEITLEEYKNAMTLEDYELDVEINKFSIKKYYKKMTHNQAKILALWMIGLSNKAVSLLMNSSPTYIFLEKTRIETKFKRLIREEKKRNGIR